MKQIYIVTGWRFDMNGIVHDYIYVGHDAEIASQQEKESQENGEYFRVERRGFTSEGSNTFEFLTTVWAKE